MAAPWPVQRSVVLAAAMAFGATPPASAQTPHISDVFFPYTSTPTGSWADAVAVGDLNADGRNDVALVTALRLDPATDHRLYVFVQNAEGTLAAAVPYVLAGKPQSVAIGDLDDDGLNDVAVGVESGVGVLRQNGHGTLEPMDLMPASDARLVRVADLDNDGKSDLVAIGDATNTASVFLQNADGGLDAPIVYSVPHLGHDDLEVADVNGDGLTDVIVMSGSNGFVPDFSVLYQLADGTLGELVSRSAGEFGHLGDGLGAGDVTGDGRADIVIALRGSSFSGNTHFLAVFAQQDDGTLPPTPTYQVARPYAAGALDVADVTGDGRGDVVALEGTHGVAVHRQSAGGLLPARKHPLPYMIPRSGHGMALGDVNGDGRNDLVLANFDLGLLVLLQAPPQVVVTMPAADITTGGPRAVQWLAGLGPFASFDVAYSVDGGASFADVPGCVGLPADTRDCTWLAPGPVALDARIRVTGKDAANAPVAAGMAAFAIAEPFLRVTEPNMATVFVPGQFRAIAWSGNLGSSEKVTVALSRDDGQTWSTLAANASNHPGGGDMAWQVTGPATVAARVRVTWNANGDVSDVGDEAFTINTSPVARAGPDRDTAVGADVLLDGSTSSDADGHPLTYVWLDPAGAVISTAPQAHVVASFGATTYTLVVHDVLGSSSADTITVRAPDAAPPAVDIFAPYPGLHVTAGESVALRWTAVDQGTIVSFDVSHSTDGGLSYAGVPGCTGLLGTARSCDWIPPPSEPPVAVRVVGRDAFGNAGVDVATYPVVGQRSFVEVTLAARPSVWAMGSVRTIHWTHDLGRTSFRIEISRDGGATWEVISASVLSDAFSGSYPWQVTGPPTRRARIRVRSRTVPELSGVSERLRIGR